MTNHFMNDLTESIQVLSTTQHDWGGTRVVLGALYIRLADSGGYVGCGCGAQGASDPKPKVSQAFYGRWGQLAHLAKLQSFIRKRNRQKSNIDKQNHQQETVGELSPCLGIT